MTFTEIRDEESEMTNADKLFNTSARKKLLTNYSLEITGRDIDSLVSASSLIPPGTKINVTFLGNENLEIRVNAAQVVRELGFIPVPHIAARRIPSREALVEFVGSLREVGAAEHVFAVGGDPVEPEGIYESALSLIESGVFAEFGVSEVSVAGYPEGHPDISSSELWAHLEAKCVALRDQGMQSTILTQFGFDTSPVMNWIHGVRDRNIDSAIRIGTPGPAGIKRLLSFARRFGIGANAMIVKKYGFSLTNLMGSAGPDKFVNELADLISEDSLLGEVALHFYAFGGIEATASWSRAYADRNASK